MISRISAGTLKRGGIVAVDNSNIALARYSSPSDARQGLERCLSGRNMMMTAPCNLVRRFQRVRYGLWRF